MGDVKNAHEDWEVAKQLQNVPLKDRERFEHVHIATKYWVARNGLAYELNKLGNTRCPVCCGYAHRFESCPTYKKLKHFKSAVGFGGCI